MNATITMASVHCRAFSRTSLTPKGTSFGGDAFGAATGLVSSEVPSILELEVNECASTGGAQAKVDYHERRNGHPHGARRKPIPEPGLVPEFIKPNQGHNREHQCGNSRILPGRRENPPHDKPGVIQ